jgi:hypothetical protein
LPAIDNHLITKPFSSKDRVACRWVNMKLSCNAGISIGDFRAVTANHHRQTGAFVYEREKISQFFTGLGKNITFDTGDLIALITIGHILTHFGRKSSGWGSQWQFSILL